MRQASKKWLIGGVVIVAVVAVVVGAKYYNIDIGRFFAAELPTPTPTPTSSTLTVYPTVDGEIDSVGGATYAAAHNAASGTGLDASSTADLVAANTVNGGGFNVKRALLNFDTSALPDNAVISSVTLKLYSTGPVSADADAVSVVGNSGASPTTYTIADFNKFGTIKYAGDLPFLSLSGGGYNTFTFNATGISAINLTGITKLGLRTARDIANTAPTGVNYAYLTATDAGSNKPTLTITYTVPTPTSTPTPTKTATPTPELPASVQMTPVDLPSMVLVNGQQTLFGARAVFASGALTSWHEATFSINKSASILVENWKFFENDSDITSLGTVTVSSGVVTFYFPSPRYLTNNTTLSVQGTVMGVNPTGNDTITTTLSWLGGVQNGTTINGLPITESLPPQAPLPAHIDISLVPLPSTVLAPGQVTLSKVKASLSQGRPTSWGTVTYSVNISPGVTLSGWKLLENGSDITSLGTVTVSPDNTVTFRFATPSTITDTDSQTLEVRAVVSGTIGVNAYVATKLTALTYLTVTLPTDTQALHN